MAKRYDPIMCMLVDEPTKAQDELKIKKEDGLWCVYKDGKVVGQSNSEAGAIRIYNRRESANKAQDELSLAQKKQVVVELKGYLKKSYNFSDESEYARAYEDLRHMFTTGSRKSISGLFENTVKKTGAHDAKTKDAEFQMYGPEFHHPIIKASSKEEAIKKAKEIYGWGGKVEAVKVSDSASTLDEAIKTCDGMFQQIFGKYSSAAKQHYDRAVKELDSFKGEIKDYLTLAGKWEMQIRNDLARIDEAYNAAGNDYYAARREIQETLDSLTQVMLRKAREKRK